MTPLEKADLLQGTLDLLILKVVALGPVHGYGISQRELGVDELEFSGFHLGEIEDVVQDDQQRFRGRLHGR